MENSNGASGQDGLGFPNPEEIKQWSVKQPDRQFCDNATLWGLCTGKEQDVW